MTEEERSVWHVGYINYFYTIFFKATGEQVNNYETLIKRDILGNLEEKEEFPLEVKAAYVGSRTWKSKGTDYYTCHP